MKLNLKMTLLTDTIFGNGVSVPGGEDISVLTDIDGFPYYKGGTFKGVFREELENLAAWDPNLDVDVDEKMGRPGDDAIENGKIRFSDFEVSQAVKDKVKEEIKDSQDDILNAFTYLRTFTALNKDTGMAKEGSLRVCRCVKAGISFYSTIDCSQGDEAWIKEVLALINWIGTMRNRGFGKVKIETI